jgi:hypothetical protein
MDMKPTMEVFLDKIERLKANAGVDLSTTEDLSIAVMNLISLEEHFFFTGAKTEKTEYFDTTSEIREMRKELLRELMPEHEGETWCASKHLLAATMRLIEVGNKLQSEDKSEEAKKMFERAYKIYSLFWALKLKLANVHQVKKEAGNSILLEDIVTKLADCCNE